MNAYVEQNLHDIEAIRQLKARYVRFGDEKNWEEFAELFTEDCEFVFDIMPRREPEAAQSGHIQGLANFLEGMSAFLEGVTTVHQVFSPEIVLTSLDQAEGIWAMHDYVEMPTCVFRGFGHYREAYLKMDGAWKIKRTETTRLRYEEHWR